MYSWNDFAGVDICEVLNVPREEKDQQKVENKELM